jgi:hypothetical protein
MAALDLLRLSESIITAATSELVAPSEFDLSASAADCAEDRGLTEAIVLQVSDILANVALSYRFRFT